MPDKIIHRIFFGFGGAPDPYIPYLENWKKFLPDYEIRHWNLSNLPVENCFFSREMLRHRDHAFLSDYFRWWVLREHGGIYLDADIEIINRDVLDRLVEDLRRSGDYSAVIGIDNREGGWYTGHSVISKPRSAYSQFMCDVYEGMGPVSFWRRKIFYFMSPQLSSLYFAYNGYNVDGMGSSPGLDAPTVVCDVRVLPQEYFSPLTPALRNGKPDFLLDAYTENTAICHHFSCSWHDEASPYLRAKEKTLGKCVTLAELLQSGRYAPKSPSVFRSFLARALGALRQS